MTLNDCVNEALYYEHSREAYDIFKTIKEIALGEMALADVKYWEENVEFFENKKVDLAPAYLQYDHMKDRVGDITSGISSKIKKVASSIKTGFKKLIKTFCAFFKRVFHIKSKKKESSSTSVNESVLFESNDNENLEEKLQELEKKYQEKFVIVDQKNLPKDAWYSSVNDKHLRSVAVAIDSFSVVVRPGCVNGNKVCILPPKVICDILNDLSLEESEFRSVNVHSLEASIKSGWNQIHKKGYDVFGDDMKAEDIQSLAEKVVGSFAALDKICTSQGGGPDADRLSKMSDILITMQLCAANAIKTTNEFLAFQKDGKKMFASYMTKKD